MGSTAKQFLRGTGILIGLFVVGAAATNWGKLLTSAGTAGTGFVKTLQGR